MRNHPKCEELVTVVAYIIGGGRLQGWTSEASSEKRFEGIYFFCRELLQFSLSTTATLGTEESGHCREVEMWVNVWTVHQTKNGHHREVAIVERWPLVEVRL